MTVLANNVVNQYIPDLFEPLPFLAVSERSNLDAELSENYVDMCPNSHSNTHDIVNCMFYELALYFTTFHFEPATCMWFCSYFPSGFIAPVTFTIRVWSRDGRLLVEPCHLSGHFTTYNEIQENLVVSTNNYMASNNPNINIGLQPQ
jgi:hypothetical protein